nr:MAG TPA: hypothetical protein [Caudoviricetes sp.]
MPFSYLFHHLIDFPLLNKHNSNRLRGNNN